MSKTNKWLKWAAQVNVNYHDGHMSTERAELMAGPEPQKYIVDAGYERQHLDDYDATLADFEAMTGRGL